MDFTSANRCTSNVLWHQCDVIAPLQFKMAPKMAPPFMRQNNGCFTSSKEMNKLQNLKLTRFTKAAETVLYRIKGRRIIDLEYFGSQFDIGCSACGRGVRFRNVTAEQYYRLSSRLTFGCPCCQSTSSVTSKTLKKKIYRKRGAYAFNVEEALCK